MTRATSIHVAIGATLLVGGCSSSTFSSVEIVAPTARVPISMTTTLLDRDGVVDERRSKRVGKFSFTYDECVEDETAVVDISKAVNEQVDAAGGDAVVALRVDAMEARCAVVRVRGKIVEVHER